MPRKIKKIVWKDKGGGLIDGARISKHEKRIRGMISKYFPALVCIAAGMGKYDLRAECRIEVGKSLVNFDPFEAINGITKDVSRKTKSDEDHLKWKRENMVEALEKAEERWVCKRLHNYLMRLRFNNSPAEKGGTTVSLDAILASSNRVLDMDGSEKSCFGPDAEQESDSLAQQLFGTQDSSLNMSQLDLNRAVEDEENLLQIEPLQGKKGVQNYLRLLGESDPDRLDNLMAFMEQKHNAQSVRIYNSKEDGETSFDSTDGESMSEGDGESDS